MGAVDRVDQVEIQLGHLCNNRCVFCASGFITAAGQAGQIDSEPVYTHLADARARGARRVTFVGGEPTLQRELPRFIARARELGFEEIVLFTNGVRGPQRAYFEELLLGGALELRMSIQGGDAETHDRVVGRKGAFQRLLDGLALARAHGRRVTVNACLNAVSHASVGGYPELVRRFGIEQLHLDQVNPDMMGERPAGHLGTVLARYSVQAPRLARMLAELERDPGPDFDVNIGNLPYCVMPEWAHRIHHDGEATFVFPADPGGLSEGGYDKYPFRGQGRQKPASCASCAFQPMCSGIFDAYAARFGVDELVPVPLERLARQRNAPRLFTLVAREPLARLVAAGAPPGFELRESATRLGEPEALLCYRGPTGSEVSIALRHPTAPGTPLVRGRVASLFVGSDAFEAAHLPLVSWVARQLGETPPALSFEQVHARLRFAADARATLARIVERLLAGGQAGTARVARDRESASVAVRVADGPPLHVRFATRPAFERPPVRAIFPPGKGSGVADPALGAILGTLRSALAATAG